MLLLLKTNFQDPKRKPCTNPFAFKWEATLMYIVKANLAHFLSFWPEEEAMGGSAARWGEWGYLALPLSAGSAIPVAAQPSHQVLLLSCSGRIAVLSRCKGSGLGQLKTPLPGKKAVEPSYRWHWLSGLAFSKSSWVVSKGIQVAPQTFPSIFPWYTTRAGALPICQKCLCTFIQTPSLTFKFYFLFFFQENSSDWREKVFLQSHTCFWGEPRP